jgi:hypothetical protein
VLLDEGVRGRRHAVQPAQEHNLAVEVVDFDRPGAALQALPGRSTGARLPADGLRVEQVAAPRGVLVGGDMVDPRGGEAARPSASTSSASRPRRAAGPQSASTALPRFVSSFVYFQRMMSGRATDSNDAASSVAATPSVVELVPLG